MQNKTEPGKMNIFFTFLSLFFHFFFTLQIRFFHGVFTSVFTVHLTAISGPLQYPSHGSTSDPGAPPNTPGPWIQDSLPSRILDPGSKAPGLGRAPKNRQVPGSGIFAEVCRHMYIRHYYRSVLISFVGCGVLVACGQHMYGLLPGSQGLRSLLWQLWGNMPRKIVVT